MESSNNTFFVDNFNFMEPGHELDLQEKLLKFHSETNKIQIKLPKNAWDASYGMLKKFSRIENGEKILKRTRLFELRSSFLVDPELMRMSFGFLGQNCKINIHAEFETSQHLLDFANEYDEDERISYFIRTLQLNSEKDLQQLRDIDHFSIERVKINLHHEKFTNVKDAMHNFELAIKSWKFSTLIIDKARGIGDWDFSWLHQIDQTLKILELDSTVYEVEFDNNQDGLGLLGDKKLYC